jgi:hypothetical protein
MARRIREVIESIVFAGMKPGGAPATQSTRMRWLGPLQKPVERFLSGGPAPSDPLYLTNRTVGQRIRVAVVVGVPCLIVGSVIAMVLSRYVVKAPPPDKPAMSPAEIAAKMLPNIDRVKIDTNRDLDVMEVHVDHTKGTAVTGTVMNNTTHEIQSAEIVFDLTDSTGSQLGGVSQRIEHLAPQIRQAFRLPVEQSTAMYALVREVKTQ